MDTKLISSDRFISLGLMLALLQLGEVREFEKQGVSDRSWKKGAEEAGKELESR